MRSAGKGLATHDLHLTSPHLSEGNGDFLFADGEEFVTTRHGGISMYYHCHVIQNPGTCGARVLYKLLTSYYAAMSSSIFA